MSATDKDRTVKFISKLLELTQIGDITWRISGDRQYVADISGRKVRLRREVREVVDVHSAFRVASAGARITAEDKRKIVVTIMEMLSVADHVSYRFDGSPGLDDLFDSAAYAASGVSSFMDDILSK